MSLNLPSISYTWSEMRHLGGLIRQAAPGVTLSDHQIVLSAFLPSFVPKNWPSYEHVHASYEAHFLISGEGEIITGRKQYVGPGSVFIYPPMTPHAWITHDSFCNSFVIKFSIEPSITTRLPEEWPVSPEILWQLAFLFQDAEEALPGWTDRVNCHMASLLSRTMVLLGWPDQPTFPQASLPVDITETTQYLRVIEQFIIENLRYPLTLDDIARAVGTSRRTLSRHFRQATGHSVMDYISKIRIDGAKAHLRETNLQISEVGAIVGMPETSSFCRSFRLATGMTPQQYRHAESEPE